MPTCSGVAAILSLSRATKFFMLDGSTVSKDINAAATSDHKNAEKAGLVLVIPEAIMILDATSVARVVASVFEASVTIAAVVIARYGLAAHAYSSVCAHLIPIVQNKGAAAILDGVDATQDMGRLGADGLFLHAKGESWVDDTLDLLERFDGKKMIGLYGAFDRDMALTAGDIGPDAVFFGPLGGDIKPEPHKKNMKIAEWWAEMVEIPCIVPAGSATESVVEASQTRADFVALSRAVFQADDPASAVTKAAQMLQEHGAALPYEASNA